MSTFAGEVHPLAAKFPMLDQHDLGELAVDIQQNGLNRALVIDAAGVLLDGRNRLAACQLVGIKPRFEVFGGDDPVTFIISENLNRRHLTPSQRAMLAVEVLPFFEAQAQERYAETVGRPAKSGATLPQISDPAPEPVRAPKATERAATAVGVSGRSVAKAKVIADQAPDLAEKVTAGEITVSDAEKQARQRKAEAEAQQAKTTEIQGRAVTAEDVLAKFPFVGGPAGVCTTAEKLDIASAVARQFNAYPDHESLDALAERARNAWRGEAAKVAKGYVTAVKASRTRPGVADAIAADARHLIEPLRDALYDAIDDAEQILRTLEKANA